MKSLKLTLLIVALSLFAGCTFNVSRSGNGGLLVETEIPESVLQQVIQIAVEQDVQLKTVDVKFLPGVIQASGSRQREGSSEVDTLSFSLVLGAANGLPTAIITNAVLNNEPVSQDLINQWNQRIADGILRFASQTPNAKVNHIEVKEGSAVLSLLVSR